MLRKGAVESLLFTSGVVTRPKQRKLESESPGTNKLFLATYNQML